MNVEVVIREPEAVREKYFAMHKLLRQHGESHKTAMDRTREAYTRELRDACIETVDQMELGLISAINAKQDICE